MTYITIASSSVGQGVTLYCMAGVYDRDAWYRVQYGACIRDFSGPLAYDGAMHEFNTSVRHALESESLIEGGDNVL